MESKSFTIFRRTVGRIQMFFWTKTIYNARKIIPQNLSLLGLAVLEELTKRERNKHTHKLTDILFL